MHKKSFSLPSSKPWPQICSGFSQTGTSKYKSPPEKDSIGTERAKEICFYFACAFALLAASQLTQMFLFLSIPILQKYIK